MLEKSLLLLAQQMGGDMAYWPLVTSSYSNLPNNSSVQTKTPCLIMRVYGYVSVILPDSEEELSVGSTDSKWVDVCTMVPTGSTIKAGYESAAHYHPITRWIKIPELTSGGGNPSGVSHAANLKNYEVAA